MNRYGAYTLMFGLALSGALFSCASDNDDKGEQGYDITTMGAGSCPNLPEFYRRVNSLDENGWVRRHTVSMKPADRNSEGPSTPRSNYISLLTFSNFEFVEQPVAEYRLEAPVVTQNGCSTVNIGAMAFEVREASPGFLRIANMVPDPKDTDPDVTKRKKIEKNSFAYSFTSPRSVDIQSSELKIDTCYGDRMIRVDKKTRMRWGPADDASIDEPQEVDPSFLTRATRALEPGSVPEGIRRLNGETAATVLVPVSDLRGFKASAVRADLKPCPFRPGPPDVGDPEMPTSETTIPTPDVSETAPVPVPSL